MACGKAAGSSDTEAYVFWYVEVDGRPRTQREAIFSCRSMAEMAHAGENHRHPMFIRSLDHFCIPD